MCSDKKKEVRPSSDRVCGPRHFGLDHAVGRADSGLQCECTAANRNAADSGTVRVSGGTLFLAHADRGRAGEREAGGLKIDSAKLIFGHGTVINFKLLVLYG